MNHNPSPIVGNGGYNQYPPQQGYPPVYGNPPQNGYNSPTHPNIISHNHINMAPQPPPPQIIINQGGGLRGCPFCKSRSGVVDTQVMGCAVIGWSVALFCLTGCCCWIPFVISDCFDRELRCMQCGGTVQRFNSRYGC